jgi:hypothetical protein
MLRCCGEWKRPETRPSFRHVLEMEHVLEIACFIGETRLQQRKRSFVSILSNSGGSDPHEAGTLKHRQRRSDFVDGRDCWTFADSTYSTGSGIPDGGNKSVAQFSAGELYTGNVVRSRKSSPKLELDANTRKRLVLDPTLGSNDAR